jgi:hypothetical protein
MLMGGLKESQQSSIALRDIQYSSFMVILEFLYTQKINLPEQVNLLEIMSLANLYILEDLKIQLVKEIKRFLAADNVEEVKQIAQVLNLEDLYTMCIEFKK